MNKQENLNILANILQIYNTLLLQNDAKNNDIMQALQEQNTKYFEQIIKMLEDINSKLSDLEEKVSSLK